MISNPHLLSSKTDYFNNPITRDYIDSLSSLSATLNMRIRLVNEIVYNRNDNGLKSSTL